MYRGDILGARRNSRALGAIRALRARQARQERKIEILCKDMVAAHGEFAEKLSIMQFTVLFQDALLGVREKGLLLERAAEELCKGLCRAHTAVFVAGRKGFEIYICQDGDIGREHLQNWFGPELAAELSLSHKICSLEEMLEMGLQASPGSLKNLTAVAVPMGRSGEASGFILLWRGAERPFGKWELARAAAAASGLRMAIVHFGHKPTGRAEGLKTGAR